MCSANSRSQGHVGLFYETIHLKGPTTHWWTRRRLGSRDIIYGSTDILGLFVHDTTFISKQSWNIAYEKIYFNIYQEYLVLKRHAHICASTSGNGMYA